ncbi:hypothetical protein [Sandaracinus amylolyticus]|uniref:Uncharacterized protein n=1 Tax=Sandaracinus amylolyticus TaxID=927083 RepID=A0A0F6W6P6_9BACT|nr:hypothetical protein [Sandaracinus amylolyticus]AKF08893.1 hypothetical protein DB32_006042 [Sandaracinus amylolyticus]
MTNLAMLKATGRGTLSARASIEGLGVEFVTRPEMAGTAADGRVRVESLKLDGFKTTERAHLQRSTLEAKGATIKLADVGGKVTRALAAEPEHTTWLTQTVDHDDTAIVVASTAGWPTSGVLHIDTEAIRYTGLGTTTIGSATYGTFTGCTRGIWDTIAQHHYVGIGSTLRYPEVTSSVTVLQGRRVRLHLYERGDDPQGDGTQRWLGVVSGSPRMSGPQWSIMLDPISSILDAELGVGLDQQTGARGIRYSAAEPFRLSLQRKPGNPDVEYTDHGSAAWIWGVGSERPLIEFPSASHDGFFESQDEFLATVQSEIDAATAGWNTAVFIEPYGNAFRFRVYSGGSPDGVAIILSSSGNTFGSPRGPACDGLLIPALYTSDTAPEGLPETTIVAGTDYYAYLHGSVRGGGQVPRGIFGTPEIARTHTALEADSPAYRIFLGGAVAAPPAGSTALVEWSDTDTEKSYRVVGSDPARRAVDLERGSSPDDPGFHFFTPELPVSIRFGRSYGATSTSSGLGTFTLMQALEDEAPEQVNLGAQPMIQPGDWNAAEWEAAYAGASALATQRRYTTFEAIALADLLTPDLQLVSHFLAFDSQGRLTIKRLRLASATEAATFVIDRDTLIGWPTYERSPLGQTNTLALVGGYDAREGEAVGQPFTVRDAGSYGRAPAARILKIEPRSAYIGPPITPDDVMEVAQTVLGIFSGPYAYVTCEVPLTAIDALLGSTVSFSTRHLPNESGARGMDGQIGLVLAREIDWYGAKIQLTVLVDARRIAGYAPAGLVTGQTNTAGTTWAITLDARTFASGEDAADHFVAGDVVFVQEFDDASPTVVDGEVVSATGYVVTVDLPGGWTPGASTWMLITRAATTPPSARQKRYAFVAGSDARIGFSDGEESARQFAP